MVEPISRWLVPCTLPVALLAAALTANAQPAVRAARPDPLDPKASVPTLSYESSFSQYKRLGDEKPVSWREANDIVTRIGGWRVYAREAQQPDPAADGKPADAAPAAKPAAPASAAKPPDRASAAMPAAMPAEMVKPMPPGHGGPKTP